METITPELSSKPVKTPKTTKQTTTVPVISAVETIVPTVSAEVIGDMIIVKGIEPKITKPFDIKISEKGLEAETLAKKERKEFIESEKRRLWHLGIGKGHHLE